MQPENLKFGGGIAESNIHPLVLIALIVTGLMILFLRRQQVIVPVLYMAFLVPTGQQINMGGLHVLALRIVILVALLRALYSMTFTKTPGFAGGVSTFDKVFFLWTFFHVAAFLILFNFVSAAVVNQFGFIWDILGGYLVLRFFVQDEEDIDRVIRTFAILSGILAICMLNEHFRMENVFGYVGAMRIVPETRDGMARAQAAFSHPLLAGTFGATMVPLFLLYWHRGKSKVMASVGIIGATIMTICAASSTPFLAYAAGIGAVCFWPFRKNMRLYRWGILIALVTLNFVMKAPVWFLIAHISVFGSSSSDHRAYLVDAFVRHFSDWWLVGTNSAGNWGWDMWDTSNQYVAEGESGGLGAFVCFIAMISICFSRLGKARKAVEGDSAKEWYFWFLGSALFAHCVGFFGISYFDQTRMTLFALFVMIVVSTAHVLAAPVPAMAGVEPAAEPGLVPAGPLVPDRPPLPTHPWLNPSPRKNLLGQPGSAFKPRRS